MSFMSTSPGEIFAAAKLGYQIWKETKDARERFYKAREYADCVEASLSTSRDACNALGTAGDGLLPYLDSTKKAYDELDTYLGRFEAHFAQSPNTRGSTKLAQQARWVYEQQIDHKVENLQIILTAAVTMFSLALVPQMSVQISSIHQQTLSQTVDVAALAALAKDRLPNDTQVARVVATACWQRPRGCSCRCHISYERPWHSAILGTVGLTSLFDRCNRDDTCDTRRYAVYARFALNHFGVPLAIRLATELKIYGGFVPVLYPTIEVQRVCDFTSPGFKALEEFNASPFGIDAKERKVVELKRLFASGEASPLDVDPDGHTWLEKLLQYPWSFGLRSAQFELLEFLGRHCQKDILSNPRLLSQVSCWIGEGPHLDALSDLIRLGLDPGAMDPSLFHKWPRFSDPNWQSECLTDDPFGVEFLRQCLQIEPAEFAGCDLLATHLLTGSDKEFEEAVQAWVLSRSSTPFNVFGQSPVHLAIHLPSRLKHLVQSGMDPDSVDRGGTTPMMYAAAYGRLDSVLVLIEHGARPYLQDHLNNRIFMDYAICFRRVDLVKGFVIWLRDQGKAADALSIIDRSAHYHLINSAATLDMAVPILETLLELGADPDVLFGTSITAMHIVSRADLGKALLRCNFTAVDVQDESGKTALMHTLRFLDPDLTKALLNLQSAAGISIDRRDRTHWSLMHHLFRPRRARFAGRWEAPEVRFGLKTDTVRCMNLILRRGADALITDACECPCSPGGCSAMSIALHQALEVTRPMSYRDVLNALPVDLAIGTLAFGDEKLRTLADTVATFSAFIESGRKHSCCALTRVRPSHYCSADDAQVTDNQSATAIRYGACAVVQNVTDEKARLTNQIARFYSLLERRSQARHDDENAARIKTILVCGPKRLKDGEHRSSRSIRMAHYIGPAQKLDLQDYRAWITDCVEQRSQLYTGMSLEAWAKNAMEFVDGLNREMEMLRAET